MNRREFLLRMSSGIAAASAGCSATRAFGPAKAELPNIVMFISDDHSRRVAGCYGDKIVQTPSMDRLAREGMLFNRVFTPTAMCAPSRTTISTGLHPHRHGLHVNSGKSFSGLKRLKTYMDSIGYRYVSGGKAQIDAKKLESILAEDDPRPLCLLISSREPHGPYKAGGPYDPDTIPLPPSQVDTPETRLVESNYYTDVTLADTELGQCMDLVGKYGMTEDTCLIYTSDHGAGMPFGKWSC